MQAALHRRAGFVQLVGNLADGHLVEVAQHDDLAVMRGQGFQRSRHIVTQVVDRQAREPRFDLEMRFDFLCLYYYLTICF